MSTMLLLDTHVILWALREPEKLSEDIKSIISEFKAINQLAISSITLWEIALLMSRNRLNIYEPIESFLESLVQEKGLKVLDITPKIAAQGVLLGDAFHKDPSDRIIVATAMCYNATLVTKDYKILEWSSGGYAKTLEP